MRQIAKCFFLDHIRRRNPREEIKGSERSVFVNKSNSKSNIFMKSESFVSWGVYSPPPPPPSSLFSLLSALFGIIVRMRELKQIENR